MDKFAQKRCIMLCLVIVSGLSLLSFRLVYLQVVDRMRYADSAGNSYERKDVLMADRGVILDRNDEIIARTVRSKSVMIDKYHLRDPRIAAKGLACRELSAEADWVTWDRDRRKSKIRVRARRILEDHDPAWVVQEHLDYAIGQIARPLGMTKDELRDEIGALDKNPMDKVIYKNLSTDVAVLLEDLIKEKWIQGFRFKESTKRWYPAPLLATHLIGYPNHKGKGMAGLEKSLDHFLAGRNGYEIEMRDVTGMVMPAHKGSTLPPKNGKNVKLTLDMGLQAICEEELDRGMAEFKGVKGTIVLMDPHTGEILAMASRPHYNLNSREGVAMNGYNYALQAIYEPGSTFKVVAAAAALDAGLVGYETLVNCHNGYYRDGSVTLREEHGRGIIPVWKILQKSCNIGSYVLAKKVGSAGYYDYVKKFGFGQKTGVQLAGESSGIMRSSENPTEFASMSYGYAVSVTPLQVANAYCAIANGGKLMQPRIVKSIDTNSGIVIQRYEPEMIRRVMSEKTAANLRKALKTVVEAGGTATKADVEGFTEGGKTGTAQKNDPNKRGYLEGRYTVSFAGMLPAENPAFVCVVVIDDPLTTEVQRYGGTIAAPIWQKTATRVAAHMNLTPTEPVKDSVTQN